VVRGDSDLAQSAHETAQSIRQLWPHEASIGVILGTGACSVAEAFQPECRLAFGQLPHMACATAIGHPGQFIGGRLGGRHVAILQGRIHLYEGCSREQVQFPIRVLAALGVQTLIVTNASGGLNPTYRCGELVVIEDLIDLTGNREQGTGDRGQVYVPLRLPLPLDVGGVLLLKRGVGVSRCRKTFSSHESGRGIDGAGCND
jgi:purine nucleoside phosphorylase